MVLPKFVAQAVASIALVSPILASAQNASSSLPIVDLGYELHRATGLNETTGYYNFSNIRYAAPPVGDLRFKAPAPPVTNRSVINDGSVDRICPQSSATRDPRETEDCLFLDVVVPQKVFQKAGKGKGAPVLVWIVGGGYTSGWKNEAGDPSGLIQRSVSNSSDGVVYVALNYRLGALGWLSGPTFQQNGTANAGLRDQRFALQWVQDNIHLFGGDKDRVTVFGESAGGGSIIHQITAYGGHTKPPFQQALPQSPAWYPYTPQYAQEQVFQAFLAAANVSSLAEARALSSAQVIAANVAQLAASSYFTYGPSLDGDFVTQDPKLLLNHGQFDDSVRVLVGHNTAEGTLFATQLSNDSAVDAYIRAAFATAPSAAVDHVVTVLYPPGNVSGLYTSPTERLALIISEGIFTCNAAAFAAAPFKTPTHAYVFDVAPSLHGQDVAFSYYNPGAAPNYGPNAALFGTFQYNTTVATVLQDYIANFAVTGVPDSTIDGLDGFAAFGKNASAVRLSLGGIGVERDPAANERCAWWALGLLS